MSRHPGPQRAAGPAAEPGPSRRVDLWALCAACAGLTGLCGLSVAILEALSGDLGGMAMGLTVAVQAGTIIMLQCARRRP